MTENQIGEIVVDSAIKVHKALGPGLLESAYEACLIHELQKCDLRVESQVGLPVKYEDVVLDVGYRVDVLIEEKVILELKAIERILPIEAPRSKLRGISVCKVKCIVFVR
jgi:GxxExxY protein